jgi:photoactive yellow protein
MMSFAARQALAAQLGVTPEDFAEPLYVVDRVGRVVFCNRALTELVGSRAEDIVGRLSLQFYPPEAAPVFLLRRFDALMGRPPAAPLKTRLRASNGRAVPVALSVTNLECAGEIVGRVTVVRPAPGSGALPQTGETLGAESLLQLSPEEADALPFGLILLDPDGVIIGYNAVESRLSGLARSDVIGRNFFQDVAPCTRVRAFAGRYRQMVDAGESSHAQFDFVFRFSYGEKRVSVVLAYSPDIRQGAIAVEQRPDDAG